MEATVKLVSGPAGEQLEIKRIHPSSSANTTVCTRYAHLVTRSAKTQTNCAEIAGLRCSPWSVPMFQGRPTLHGTSPFFFSTIILGYVSLLGTPVARTRTQTHARAVSFRLSVRISRVIATYDFARCVYIQEEGNSMALVPTTRSTEATANGINVAASRSPASNGDASGSAYASSSPPLSIAFSLLLACSLVLLSLASLSGPLSGSPFHCRSSSL